MKHPRVLLIILDGWGLRPETTANPIHEAHPKYYEQLLKTYPWRSLEASGEAVGLPDGQIGNSEVGHLNIGAGRVVYQELTRIDKAIREGTFVTNEALIAAMAAAKAKDTTLHLMGLTSPGGVHSSLEHLLALIDMAHQQGVQKLRVHAFLDGRDVPPKSAKAALLKVEAKLAERSYPPIATLSGRYYAMDRDNRWERVEKAYHNLLLGNGQRFLFSEDALSAAYNRGETDEFVLPCVSDMTYDGMADEDSLLFFNFRPDRARQLTRAFVEKDFHGFHRERVLDNILFTCMAMYDETWTLPVAFAKHPLNRLLAEVLSEQGVRQFRAAETEKYAHVTYFFNGGFEEPYPGEDRKMIPSPRVNTYDLQPEMNLPTLTETVVEAILSGQYEFIATNFANPDMVGHTGKMAAALQAVQAVDEGLEKVIEMALAKGYTVLLTADHGNIEQMVDEEGEPHTAHTTDPVPLVLISHDTLLHLDTDTPAALSNIAPTILDLMDLPKPAEMTARSLLVRQKAEALNPEQAVRSY